MMIRIFNVLALLCLLPALSRSQGTMMLQSPDESICFELNISNNNPAYTISFRNRQLIVNSELGLIFSESGDFGKCLKIAEPEFRDGVEKYELVVGKNRIVSDPYREAIIPMIETGAPFKKINLVVRAFNEGIAFRYEFPAQETWSNLTLEEENTTFRFMEDPEVLALFLPNFTTSHEGLYSSLQWNSVKEDTLMDMPALFEFPGPVYISITEAALTDYAGMYLVKRNGVLTSQLSPLPGQSAIKVKAQLPHRSPWMVILISDTIGTLIESDILTSLNEPCKLTDVSWIKPGKTTWPWWNGNIITDTSFVHGNNFETQKYYIDFCARNGIEYHSVVEYGGHEWYVSDGENFAPGLNTDVTLPVPELDMQKVCDYAGTRNVGIRLWVHWAALVPKLDEAFQKYEEWGVSGLMVDFMDRDDQEMINLQEKILQKAAAHHLHIQFHGVAKPTGLSRTWPNELTREGAMNYEYDKWSDLMKPDHDIDIPFTRMIAGPVDYHLGGFRAVPDSLFQIQYERPLVYGTRCHMLAMYVVLESYLGMICDYPAAYEDQPGFDFLKMVPVTWDETIVPDAKVGEFIIVARRNDSEWFVGAITNSEVRTISIPLSFLGDGKFTAELYLDSLESDPNLLIRQTRSVSGTDVLSVPLAGGGGMVMHIHP
jgi:alpha-glucosidase